MDDPKPPRDRRDAGYIHTAYLDVHVLRRRDGFRDIPIRGVRELAAETYLKPAHGPARVAIIDAAEELSIPAANALLKTLEEPAPHAVIILIAQQASGVLPTLRSRCHHIALAPVPAALICRAPGRRARARSRDRRRHRRRGARTRRLGDRHGARREPLAGVR